MPNNTRMEEDLFKYLPQEIAIDIFSRLPIRTIINCKSVCKKWRRLLSTPEFVDCHYSKSVPSLVISKRDPGGDGPYKVLELVNSRKYSDHRPRCNTVYSFDAPRTATLHSSANGLLLFVIYKNDKLFVCNPLTREYVNLPPPILPSSSDNFTYGFGVSKVSGQYKVVRVSATKFEVYTLGTGSWRSLVGGKAWLYKSCVFWNGNLYCLLGESRMGCFDLETELFSTLPCPSSRGYETLDHPHLDALGDRLCLCLNDFDELVIWLMDGFGSWRKEFVIYEKRYGYRCETFSAIKDYGDGEILLTMEGLADLYYYSRKRKRGTLKAIRLSKWRQNSYYFRVVYTPSFLPLTTFTTENVCSF